MHFFFNFCEFILILFSYIENHFIIFRDRQKKLNISGNNRRRKIGIIHIYNKKITMILEILKRFYAILYNCSFAKIAIG